MKCDSLECYSEAVAKSNISGNKYCITCAVRLTAQFGPDAMETIEGSKFPWEYPVENTCPHCGHGYNKMIIAFTGDCPSCRRKLPGVKNDGV